jgi:hypothetical protein
METAQIKTTLHHCLALYERRNIVEGMDGWYYAADDDSHLK